MEVVKQIDEKTRVVLGKEWILFPFYSVAVFKLQRSRWYGWKTITYTYPSTHEDRGGIRNAVEYLLWHEKERCVSEYEVARRMLKLEERVQATISGVTPERSMAKALVNREI